MSIKTILHMCFKGFGFLAALLAATLMVVPELGLGAGSGGGIGGASSGAGKASNGAASTGSFVSGNRVGTGSSTSRSAFSHRFLGSSIRPAWHNWRFHHHRHLLIFPVFGYSFYCYPCYGPFWPYFSYNPCGNYYSAWSAPFTYSRSPLGNELASIYTAPAQVDSAYENKGAEQVANSSAESNAFVRQGEDALKVRDYRLAVRAWRHAVVDDPKNGATIMMLGQALFAVGDYDEAAAAVQQAMMLLPEEKWGGVVSQFRGLYTNIQDYFDQLTELAKAVEQYPNDPALRLELGFQYAYSGHPDLALRQLDKLLELVPQDPIARKLRDRVNKESKTKPSPAS